MPASLPRAPRLPVRDQLDDVAPRGMTVPATRSPDLRGRSGASVAGPDSPARPSRRASAHARPWGRFVASTRPHARRGSAIPDRCTCTCGRRSRSRRSARPDRRDPATGDLAEQVELAVRGTSATSRARFSGVRRYTMSRSRVVRAAPCALAATPPTMMNSTPASTRRAMSPPKSVIAPRSFHAAALRSDGASRSCAPSAPAGSCASSRLAAKRRRRACMPRSRDPSARRRRWAQVDRSRKPRRTQARRPGSPS
jgi:hypothetical protein